LRAGSQITCPPPFTDGAGNTVISPLLRNHSQHDNSHLRNFSLCAKGCRSYSCTQQNDTVAIEYVYFSKPQRIYLCPAMLVFPLPSDICRKRHACEPFAAQISVLGFLDVIPRTCCYWQLICRILLTSFTPDHIMYILLFYCSVYCSVFFASAARHRFLSDAVLSEPCAVLRKQASGCLATISF